MRPKKNPGIVPNKSHEIRKTAKDLVLQGKPPRPKVIKELLEAKGIPVTGAQVSTALRDTPFALRKSRTDWEGAKIALPDPLDAVRQIDPDDLPKAREFLRTMGSTQRAIAALVALGLFKKEEPEPEHYYGGA